VRQAARKAAASALGVRISPRPPCFHGLADRTPVSGTGDRRFESSWKRARHGTRRCGRQSAKLPLAGSTPARVSSALTLWTAGDGRQPGESKLIGYPLSMERLRVRAPPARHLAVAQLAERLMIRCAPPHSPAFPSSPAAVTALAVRVRVEDRRLSALQQCAPAAATTSVPAPEARPGGSKTAGYRCPTGSSPAPAAESTSARATASNPIQIRPDGRVETRNR
jgi:hypothetical protein